MGVGIGVAIDRGPATIGEDRCEGPTTEEAPNRAVLSLVVRVVNQGVHVVNKLPIKVLHTIHVIEVESIVRRVLASGLDESSRAECLAVGKVLLQGNIVPIGSLERDKRAIVVPMADAGIHTDTTGELAVTAEC